jgi:hypothetical protein
MVNMAPTTARGKWAEYVGLWQHVDGLYDHGVFLRGCGLQYVKLNQRHSLCRCTAVGNVISAMNLLSALGYSVTVVAQDADGFPTALTAIIWVPRDFQMNVMQDGGGAHEQDRIPGANGWPSESPQQGRTVARLILEYESDQDRGRRASGLFDPVRVMIGIRTDLREFVQVAREPRMNRRHFDGFITDGGRGMSITTATDTREHVERPNPLRDAEPTCMAPQHPSVLEGTNALRGFGYTIDIARVRPGDARLFAATATIVVPRWQMLEQLYNDLPKFKNW